MARRSRIPDEAGTPPDVKFAKRRRDIIALTDAEIVSVCNDLRAGREMATRTPLRWRGWT